MNWHHRFLAVTSALFLSASAGSCASYKVYVFLSENCPISRYYTLKLKDLHAKYASDKLEFTAVFPNRLSTPQTITAFKEKYGLPFPCMGDVDHALVNSLQVTITPEVVIVGPGNGAVYRGRIDNTFVRIGKRRRTTTEHDLDAVLNTLREGTPPSFRETQAVGCYITPLRDAMSK